MRIIETIHPAPQYRTFTCDQVISNVRLSDISAITGSFKEATPEVVKLYEQLREIPLLENDISVDKYSISVKIEEAFEDSEQDWKNVRDAVFYCLANFFKVDLVELEHAYSLKDDRLKYKDPVVDLGNLYDALSKIKIPHDFETHRAAWRNAIVIAKVAQEAKDIVDYEELHTGENTYWKNELEKFDAAFDALLALKLPQS